MLARRIRGWAAWNHPTPMLEMLAAVVLTMVLAALLGTPEGGG